MRAEDVRERLRQVPFRPFRICLSDQSSFVIRHPEQAVVTASTVSVAPLDGQTPGSAPDGEVLLSLVHVTRLEPIAAPLPPSTN
jgi:hypothetical protein